MSASENPIPNGNAAEPELRRVTIMFADMMGSTAMIGGLDAEDAAGLFDPALQAMIGAAERFDGAVSHRGDGIMAVFGAPTVAEDHALRACLAALAIQESLAGDDGPVRLRIGIHTGEVVFRPVRIGGALMHDAVGMAVHIAARLEQTAEGGEIVISEPARALAADYIRTEPLPPATAKGVENEIVRHRLRAAEPAPDRWRIRAARGLSPFVGRHAEFADLLAALAAPGVSAVHIAGAPGLGKSRLVHELLRHPAAAGRAVIPLIGDRHRQVAPFHPIAAWLRTRYDIRDADDDEAARARLAAAPVEGADRDRLERLLGLGAAAEPRNRIDYSATIAALLAAEGARLILHCEDLDCFDEASLDLLAGVLPRLAGHQVLLVGTGRGRVRLPGARLATIALGPLDDADAAGLLAGIDAGRAADPALAAEILRKAGGNPLFLEEVAPLAVPPAGGFDDSRPAIPDRVEELIADRLGRLAADDRRLIQLCAIVGLDVPARLLAPLARLDPDRLDAAIARLADGQLLYESRKFPDASWSFKHALTRDVAYKTVLAARRRTLHGEIVDLLESEGSGARGRNIGDLCHHALRAQRWRPAVDYLREAAQAALARTAFPAALAALRRARLVAADLPETAERDGLRLDLLVEMERVVRWSGSYAELAPILDETETLAQARGDRARVAAVLATRVHMLNITGRIEAAIALAERARAEAAEAADAGLLVTASFYTGQSYFNAGRLAEADAVLSDTLRRDDVAALMRVHCHGTRAMARAMLGDFAGAAADAADAADQAGRSGRPYDRIFADAAAGYVAHERRDDSAAIAMFRSALARSDDAGIVQLRPPALAGLGHAQLAAGDIAAGSATLTEAQRLAATEQRWMFQLFAAVGMAHAGLALGEPDLALSFADTALGIAERYGYDAYRVHGLRARGTVLAATAGRLADGVKDLKAALAGARALGLAGEIGHAQAALALATRDPAAIAAAREAYRQAGLGASAARLERALAGAAGLYL